MSVVVTLSFFTILCSGKIYICCNIADYIVCFNSCSHLVVPVIMFFQSGVFIRGLSILWFDCEAGKLLEETCLRHVSPSPLPLVPGS